MIHDIVLAVYYFEAIELNMLEGAIVSYCIKNPQFIPLSLWWQKDHSWELESLCANRNEKNVIFKKVPFYLIWIVSEISV